MSTFGVACLDCECPAFIAEDHQWTCPNCGCGFVKVVGS